MNSNHDHTITLRSRRFRARKKAARLEAEKAARAAHRAELDARRAAKGFKPALTSSERAQRTRQRQKEAVEQIRTESWFSLGVGGWQEVVQYLGTLHPMAAQKDIEAVAAQLRAECDKWQLHCNKFVLQFGIAAARRERAKVWQALEELGGDLDSLKQAMTLAESRTDITIDTSAHPSQQYEARRTAYDMSQIMLEQGKKCLIV